MSTSMQPFFAPFFFFLKIPQLLLTVKTVSKGIVLETEKKLIISYSPQHMLNPKLTETIRRRGTSLTQCLNSESQIYGISNWGEIWH